MTRTWIAINVVLLLVAALLGWQFKVARDRFYSENDISRLQPVQDLKEKMTKEGEIPPLPSPKVLSAGEFSVIPDKNLFSDTRAREEKSDKPVQVEVPQLLQKPVLVGITMSGSQRLAMIAEPGGAPNTRKTQTRRLGDTYQGYTITDITPTQIILEYGPRREVIPLFDASKHTASGGKTPILQTRIVNFGPGGSAAPGTPATGAGPALAPQTRTGPATVGGAPAGSASSGAQSGINRGNIQAKPQVPGTSTQGAPAWNESTDSQGRRVIRTPFGDVVRPNPPNE
jgi:hypothetical protein